jgi:hypothetical protein
MSKVIAVYRHLVVGASFYPAGVNAPIMFTPTGYAVTSDTPPEIASALATAASRTGTMIYREDAPKTEEQQELKVPAVENLKVASVAATGNSKDAGAATAGMVTV